MPRDAAGNYTLPSGNPVVTGTVITSTWANPTMADIGAEIGNSLSRDGQGGMRAPLQFADGSVVEPSVTFVTETTLGLFRDATGVLGVAALGQKVALFDGSSGDVIGVNQFKSSAPAPAAPADLTRKDYVDTLVNDAVQGLFDNLFPVGSKKVGGDPNGLIPGTWEQLAEGTFIMNTVGGADMAGGSNDAVVVAHGHNAESGGNHNHGVSDPGHRHYTGTAEENSRDGPRYAGSSRAIADNTYTNNAVTGISIVAGGDHTHVVNTTGEDGTGKNKPLYVGVEVWERTA